MCEEVNLFGVNRLQYIWSVKNYFSLRSSRFRFLQAKRGKRARALE